PLNFHDKLQSEDLWLGYRSTLDRTCGGGKVIHDGGKQDLLTLEFEILQTVEIDWMTPHMLELRREAQVIMGSDPGHELLNG
ncbi:unnamed protein product, partial [Linum tenue]